jgi:hypothetical protein
LRHSSRVNSDDQYNDGNLTISRLPVKGRRSLRWVKAYILFAIRDLDFSPITRMKGRIPRVFSGDMHSIALGTMFGSGALDLKGNPIHVALPGTIGTWPGGWPSVGIRGTPATPSAVLNFEEQIKPIEQHGFILADFTEDKIVLRFFTWDVKAQPVEAIDRLQPFHTAELSRPA